jgi:hypothetical protein
LIVAQCVAIMRRLVPVLVNEQFAQRPAPVAPPVIRSVDVTDDNQVLVTMSDGSEMNAGLIRTLRGPAGPKGERGPRSQRGARGASVTQILYDDGCLTFGYSDGVSHSVDIPVMIGEQGPPGIGISGAFKQGSHLLVELTDGRRIDVGELPRGERGLIGATGAEGPPGPDGIGVIGAHRRDGHLVLELSNGRNWDIGELPRGEPGARGDQGMPGVIGADGVGIVGAYKQHGHLILELTDGRRVDTGELPRGDKGDDGPAGRTGSQGANGPAGPRGQRGEIGPPGPAGLSVAGIELDGDHLFACWSDGRRQSIGSLVAGPTGPAGPAGASGTGVAEIRQVGEQVIEIHYTTGASQTVELPIGPRGETGSPGRGVASAAIQNERLVVTYDDGTTAQLGRVVGRDGRDGETPELANVQLSDAAQQLIADLVRQGVYDANLDTRADISPAGELTIHLAGNEYRCGQVHGRDGDSFVAARVDASGHLVLSRTDRDTGMLRETDLGIVKGADGRPGEPGVRGDAGLPGNSIARAGFAGNQLVLYFSDGTEQTVGEVAAPRGPGFVWAGKWKRGRTYFGQADNETGPWADVVSYGGHVWLCESQTKRAPPGEGWVRMFEETNP